MEDVKLNLSQLRHNVELCATQVLIKETKDKVEITGRFKKCQKRFKAEATGPNRITNVYTSFMRIRLKHEPVNGFSFGRMPVIADRAW